MTQQYQPPAPPPGWTPQPTAPFSAQQAPPPKNGFGVVALILGLIGLLFSIMPITGFVAVILGITGLILGLVGVGRIRSRRATNLKTTIVGVTASVAAVAVGIWGVTIFFGAVDQLGKDLSSLDQPSTVVTEAPTSAPESSADDVAPPADDEPAPEKVQSFTIGQKATVTEDGAESGEITVSNVEKSTKAQNEYTDPPENGQFWIFTVKAKALGTEVFSINPFDFYVVDAEGNRYDQTSGSMYIIDSGSLNATELNPGEQTQGRFAVDAPKDATQVVYAPGLRALGYWTLAD